MAEGPPSSGANRAPPNDLRAESALIGAMLLQHSSVTKALARPLLSRDFYRPVHQTIYDAMISMYHDDVPIDTVTLAAHLDEGGQLETIGGAYQLITMQTNCPVAGNDDYYLDIIIGHSLMRSILQAAEEVVEHIYSKSGNWESLATELRTRVNDILVLNRERAKAHGN